MRRVVVEISMSVGGGDLTMVGHGWLWVVALK